MKKIINQPGDFAIDAIRGMQDAVNEDFCVVPEHKAIFLKTPCPGSVSVITGGGAGHFPLFEGYVGGGLCTGTVSGDVFSPPSSTDIIWLSEQVPHENGILYICGNYVADLMNFQLALNELRGRGIRAELLVVSDDVLSAKAEEKESRRAIAGIALMIKIIGAAAAKQYNMDALLQLGNRIKRQTASTGVSFSSCWLPGSVSSAFSIGENEMELGVGIHGEPGIRRTNVMSSRDIASFLVSTCTEDLKPEPGTGMAVLLNNLGAVSAEELYILYHDIKALLDAGQIIVTARHIGHFATSLGINGVSLTLLKTDKEMISLLKADCQSPFVHF